MSDDEWIEKPSRAKWMHPESSLDAMLQSTSSVYEDGKTRRAQEAAAKEAQSRLIVEQRSIVPISNSSNSTWGDKKSAWRMMKLKRLFEIAKEENKPVEELAIDRFGSLEAFQDAVKERDYLESKRPSSSNRQGQSTRAPKSFTSSSNFKRPDRSSHQPESIKAPKPLVKPVVTKPSLALMQSAASNEPNINHLPLPNSITKTIVDGHPVLSMDALNKLKAALVKARILKSPNLAALEKQYSEESQRFEDAQVDVVIVKEKNSHSNDRNFPIKGGNWKDEQLKMRKSTHDQQGNRIGYFGEQDQTLDEMVRHEKLTERFDDDGRRDQKRRRPNAPSRHEAQSAKEIKFADNVMKTCAYCWHDGEAPRAPVVAVGIKTYLSLPFNDPVSPGHCLIVPIQHCTSTIPLEDEWIEIRNFQKSLLHMFHAKDEGVIFIEQVVNLSSHRHVVIECIPVPSSVYADAPAYFREALLASEEEEWSSYPKVIETKKERGFTRSLSDKLPYFHVWLGIDSGMGHVIEDSKSWPRTFGHDVICSAMGLDALSRRDRVCGTIDDRMEHFKGLGWHQYDWTLSLE